MVFTDVNVATLVSWFITGVVMIFSGSYFMSKWKFRRYYMHLQEHRKASVFFKISANLYGLIWMLFAAAQIAAMVLWTMNYVRCNNTYYVAVVALALGEFLFVSMWAPLFARLGTPVGAAITNVIAFACGAAALILMCIIVASDGPNCTFEGTSYRGPGIAACVVWGLPIFWLVVVFAISVAVARRKHFHYDHWLHHHHFPYVHKHNVQEQEVVPHHQQQHNAYQSYGIESGITVPLKRSANLKPQ